MAQGYNWYPRLEKLAACHWQPPSSSLLIGQPPQGSLRKATMTREIPPQRFPVELMHKCRLLRPSLPAPLLVPGTRLGAAACPPPPKSRGTLRPPSSCVGAMAAPQPLDVPLACPPRRWRPAEKSIETQTCPDACPFKLTMQKMICLYVSPSCRVTAPRAPRRAGCPRLAHRAARRKGRFSTPPGPR